MKENNSTYTFDFAPIGLEIKKAILCPQACHARRALSYYEILYPQTEFMVCPTVTRDISRENWFLEPEKIDVVLGELERCGSQFHKILREYGKKHPPGI